MKRFLILLMIFASPAMAQTNTFCAVNLTCNVTAPWTLGNFNTVETVDGVRNLTVQQAINRLPTGTPGGGMVFVPPGTYVGPTTIPQGVCIVNQVDPFLPVAPPQIWSKFAGVPFNSFVPGTGSQNLVKFTYSANLTISDVSQICLMGIVMDFGGSFNLTLKGVQHSHFGIAVVNTGTTAPAITLQPDTANSFNFAENDFHWLITEGGNEGIKIGASSGTLFATNSVFRWIRVLADAQPAGTFTALDFIGNCDTNSFYFIEFWHTSAMTTWNGVVFNSFSTTVDTDADNEYLWYYAETGTAGGTSTSITVNPSFGNYVTTGVLNATTKLSQTAWGSISGYTWNRLGDVTSAYGNQGVTSPTFIANAAGSAAAVPAFTLSKVLATKWSIFDDSSDNLIFSSLGSVSLLKLTGSGQLGLLGNGNYGSFAPSAFSGNRTYTLPDVSGTMPVAQQTLNFDAVYGTYRVTADQTITAGASLANIPGLTWTMPATTALNVGFSCKLLYNETTAATSMQFGIQDVTVAPTSLMAKAREQTAATAFNAGNLPALTTTTATAIGAAFTPSAATTVWEADIDGMIEQPSNAATSVINIMAQFTTNNGVIKRGSYCQVF